MRLLQIFSPSLWLILSFSDIVFHRAKVLEFNEVHPEDQSVLSCIMSLVSHLKNHHHTKGHLGFLFCYHLGDCSHEIKRCLHFGRKVMTNLDSILKSRNITLPTMVHLAMAMVSPVVM